jgi:hypothetical protein
MKGRFVYPAALAAAAFASVTAAAKGKPGIDRLSF